MGFFDLSGALGRNFGSIGIALNEISTRLTAQIAPVRHLSGPSSARAELCLDILCQVLAVPDRIAITIESAIPEHVGLGSGTQMALAIGSALNALYGLGLTVRDMAAITERGLRSGIGIGIFEQGGLVVDGGRGDKTVTPPLLVRMAVPEDWRFVLVFDRRGQGLHGAREVQAFSALPPFSPLEAARLCHLLLMQGLPAIAEQDLTQFGAVISELQRSVGGHFAAAQGGVFTSQEVAAVIAWFAEQGATAIGQTSWGPTGFCAMQGIADTDAVAQEARRRFAHFEHLSILTASARNTGGEVIVT